MNTTTTGADCKTCLICNVQYIGHHNCTEDIPQFYGPFFGPIITDQKLDKIIELLEKLIKKG